MNKKFDGKLTALRRELTSAKNRAWVLGRIKHEETPTDIRRLIASLVSDHQESIFTDSLFPVSAEKLGHASVVRSSELFRELLWFLVTLRPFKQQIEHFINIESNFSSDFFRGNYAECLKQLDTLETNQGVSLWSLEARLLTLKQLDQRLASEFLTSLTSTDLVHQNVKAFLSYDDLKFDPETTPDAYTDALEDLLSPISKDNWPAPEFESIRFRLNPWFGVLRYGTSVIQDLQRFALADRYIGFIVFAHHLLASRDPSLVRQLRAAISESRFYASDFRIENILSALDLHSDSKITPTDREILAAIEEYSCGDYQRCAEICIELIKSFPIYSEAYELLTKSLLRLDLDHPFEKLSLTGRLLDAQRSILKRDHSYQASLNSLAAEVIRHSFSPWAALLFAFIQRECQYQAVAKRHLDALFETLTLQPTNPRRLRGLEAKNAIKGQIDAVRRLSGRTKNVLSVLQSTYGMPASVLRPDSDFDIFEPTRAKRLLAKRYVSEGKTFDAINTLEILNDQQQNPLDSDDITIDLVRCYVIQGEHVKLVKLLAKIGVSSRELWRKIPVATIVEKVQKNHWMQVRHLIEWPIVLEIASRGYVQGIDLFVTDAIEDFLADASIQTPSLLSVAHLHAQPLTGYFLQHVCTEKNLETSLLFASREMLESERIGICQVALGVVDSNEDKTGLQEEVKLLSQRSIVRQRLTEISQGKIFVDVEGLTTQQDDSQRTNFEHYVQLRKKRPISISAARIVKAGSSLEIRLVPDPRFQIFKRLFLDFRDRFLLSPRHGLDAYLSVRIRHGTLEGQLRKVFSQNGLVTTQDESGNYRDNTSWIELFPAGSEDSVHNAFRKFSSKIDSQIDQIKTQWIQVSTEKRLNSGLFDYRYSDFQLIALERNFEGMSTYAEFISKCADALWSTTEDNLSSIRSKITTRLFESLYTSLLELQSDLSAIRSLEKTDLLRAILTTGTALQDELRNTAEWFYIQQTPTSRDYPLDLPLLIGQEIVRNIYPDTKLNIKHNNLDLFFLHGKTLPYLVDIIFILLDNVIKHSGSVRPNVHVSAQRDGCYLQIEVKNDIAISDSMNESSELCERLAQLRTALDMDETYSKVNLEGGTGLHKIKKIITVDLRSQCALDFGVSNDTDFFVRLGIQLDKVLCEATNC